MDASDAVFLKRAVLLVTLAILSFLIWYLFDVVMIVIGALILAILLQLGAEPFIKRFRFPRPIGLTLCSV